MFLVVKYRVETAAGTILFLEKDQIPVVTELEKIKKGLPFAFSSLNEFREENRKYMGRNRVVCDKVEEGREGMLLYVSLYLEDLGKGR